MVKLQPPIYERILLHYASEGFLSIAIPCSLTVSPGWQTSLSASPHLCAPHQEHPALPGKRTSLPSGVLLTLPSTTGDLRASAWAYLQAERQVTAVTLAAGV